MLHYRQVIVLLLWGCRSPDPVDTESVPTGPDALADAGGPVRGLVGETLVLDGTASVGTAFAWTTSDGQRADGALVEVRFERPGHYNAVIEVTDARGSSDTASVPITVTWPRLQTPPVAGSAMAADGDRVFVVLPDFDLLAEVDRVSRQVVAWVPTCGTPRSVAVGHGARWVACEGDAVSRITDAGREDLVFDWGSRPFAIVAREKDVLVTLQGAGAVAVVSAAGALQRLVPVVPDVRGLAATEAQVLVTQYRSPDEGGVVVVLDAALETQQMVRLGIDPGPDSDTNARGLPNLLQRPAIRPDGRVAVVGGSKANIERGLFRDGLPLTFETTVRADLRQVVLDPAEGPVGSEGVPAMFDDRDEALAVAYAPDGEWLFVLQPGMETLDVLDGYTLGRAGAAQNVGSGAQAVWISPESPEAWVYAALSRTLTVFDLASVAIPVPLATVSLLPPAGEVVDAEVLWGRTLFGRSVDPRMNTGGYVSCASCHPEGDHDGRTWDFTDRNEGLRNTISLRGRAGAAPLHWSANFDELQDFENDIRGPQAGQGFLSDADFDAVSDPLGAPKAGLSPELDALAAYMASLDAPYRSPHRAPDGGLSPLAAAGEAMFLDPLAGCVTCHLPPATTDSAWLSPGVPLLHDVGTLGLGSGSRRGESLTGLDTPSLRGLWSTAPYLHDGSAASVMDVLVARNPTDQHGMVADAAALEAYLLSLE